MDEAQLEDLLHAARTATDPEGRVYTLLDYALHRPGDLRWREQLLRDLTPDNDPRLLGGHLNQLTVYPGHGVFAVPAVLRLTAHPNRWVRGWAAEVLMILAHDFPAWVTPTDTVSRK